MLARCSHGTHAVLTRDSRGTAARSATQQHSAMRRSRLDRYASLRRDLDAHGDRRARLKAHAASNRQHHGPMQTCSKQSRLHGMVLVASHTQVSEADVDKSIERMPVKIVGRAITLENFVALVSPPHPRPPIPHTLRRPCSPCYICAGTGLTPSTSAPGLGSPPSHLRRDWPHACHICSRDRARACHICTGIRPAPS